MGSKGSKAKKGGEAAAKQEKKEEVVTKGKGAAVERVQKELEKNVAKKDAAAPPPAPSGSSNVKFERNQWVVEKATGEVKVTVEKHMHAVAIYNADGATVKISGKCASILLDGSKKTSVFVEDVVGTLEISNCKSVKVYVSGVLPSAAIDKSDGVLLDLPEKTIGSDAFMITAANSSEMNVAFEDNGEKIELPLPEQFVSKVVDKNGKNAIETTVSALYEA